MRELLYLGGSAFFFALVLTPLCRNLFLRLGIVDYPDETRKFHRRPIPHMGGAPLVLAYVLSFAVVSTLGRTHALDLSLLIRIAPAATIVFAIGVLDDWLGLSPLQKLSAQLIAVGWAVSLGVQITGVAGYHLSPWLSVPVTVVWLIACTNAFNLIDGVDGLAAGVGLFATATTLIAALMQHNIPLALLTAPLAGALIGFLRYNFNPATIFLGDSGSLLVGFLLGCFGVVWSQKSATILGMTAPLMALSIPILDVLLSIARRFLRRKSIIEGDRGHIHHMLLERGLSPRRVVLLMYGLAGLAAIFSLFQSVAANRFSGAVILVFCAVAWMGIQNLGYDEFDQARRMILAGGFREALNSQLALRTFRDSLALAKSQEESWTILVENARAFGFAEIRWQIGDSLFIETLSDLERDAAWELRVPTGPDDFVHLTCSIAHGPISLNISSFADAIRSSLINSYSLPVGEESRHVLNPLSATRDS